MEKSESIKEIALALSKFQGEAVNPRNTSLNPSYNSKYAPLCEVINTVRQGLSKFGLSVIQIPYTDGDNVIIETMLLHSSGEWIKSKPLSLKMEKITAQGAGGAITYGRRYALSALLNISSEEDCDGNSMNDEPLPEVLFEHNNKQYNRTSYEATNEQKSDYREELITEKQVYYINVLANMNGIDDLSLKNYCRSLFNKEDLRTLTKKEGSNLIDTMQELGNNKGA